ncbi:PREDICTED: pentatricopeptide repeat-containing protein At4g21065-like [Fragaria vesca subsp. vesca]|uniref:pentatricopeptide repeat-containing protein At4g21065-like n=1 Tax=Fragaria vesca subsp. vesca TaxID=101020 RepID=UPI0002C2F579|nr:PREDICTED: pentatricopeptide repeat-containing protein At4g21065-like [Fragaria vesca subsp. vesca]
MSMNRVYKFHAWLIKTGQQNHPPALRRLLLWCAATPSPKCLSYFRALFAYIPSPDTFAYNTIIRAHVAAHSSPSHAISFFTQMRQQGVPPDNFTFPFLLKACARLQLGQDVHTHILKLGFLSDVYVQNALISFYGSCGSVELALNVFHAMHEKDLVSWSSMISSFTNNGFFNEALALFRQMQHAKNVMPDEVTMLSVISAVSSLGALELGQRVHYYIKKSGLELTVSLGTALIDMYSRCGMVDKSIEVFDEMPLKNVQTWTALSTGLAVHGRSREALRVFYEMKKAGLQPDHMSITGILVACSHGGLVQDGWRVFKSMKDEYGLEPMLKHYGCMVDLLGRAGLLCEAYEFVEKMPIRPNSVIWRTLLGACVNHNHLVLAKKVKKRLNKLDSYHDGDYVLLANAYGGAGRWVEKANVRNSMRAIGVNKKAGSSSISVDHITHEFISGDNSHPQSQSIRDFLDRILESIKDTGYTPLTSNVLHDIEEEEKEHTLGYHSEKLAVAFALMSVKDTRTIRVMKNIRICNDCHSFMKHVSAKFGREIIVRDRNRFHHFTNGSCSCQDYW